LAGVPLKESRIEESSEFMYEKIGKTLAQKQPMLDVDSDQFVQAVYPEMIALGMTPKSAMNLINDEDFLGDVANSFYHYAQHGTNDMIDEAEGEFPPPSDPSKYPEVAATQPLPADALSTGQLTIRPTPTTSPAAGPVVGASTNPAVQQAVKDATGGQFVPKSAPPPAAEYTGPTAGGAPTNLAPGINRLTGKPNASAPPPPAPAAAPAPADPNAFNSLKNNVLPSGATTRSLAKPAPVEEDQARSEIMRRNPKGFQVTPTPLASPDARRVAALDLTKQQTEPDPLDAMKTAAGLPTIAPRTVKAVDLIKNPELAIDEPQWDYKDSQPAATGMSSDTQAQRDRIMRMAARDQMTQDQRDRITRMQQQMPDNNLTSPSVSYTADGIPRIEISAGLEESAPLEECNYTMENNYCPVHGLKECWLEEMNLSILATGSRLIEDLDEGGMPGMGAALRGAGELGGKAANAVKSLFKAEPEVSALRGPPPPRAIKYPEEHPDFPLLQAARDREQGNMKVWNKRYPEIPWAPQSDADLLKSFNHDQNVQKGFGQFQRDAMPNDYSPTGYTRAQKSKGATIDAQNSMQDNQDLFKNAYGIDEDMTDVGDVVGQAARSARDFLGKTADNISEPISNFFKGVKQGYNGKAPEQPKRPTAGQRGYDYSDEEPDQSDAETARLGRKDTGAVAMPVRSPDITTRDLPGDSMDESGRSLNYESREGDALLARIKSLALIR